MMVAPAGPLSEAIDDSFAEEEGCAGIAEEGLDRLAEGKLAGEAFGMLAGDAVADVCVAEGHSEQRVSFRQREH